MSSILGPTSPEVIAEFRAALQALIVHELSLVLGRTPDRIRARWRLLPDPAHPTLCFRPFTIFQQLCRAWAVPDCCDVHRAFERSRSTSSLHLYAVKSGDALCPIRAHGPAGTTLVDVVKLARALSAIVRSHALKTDTTTAADFSVESARGTYAGRLSSEAAFVTWTPKHMAGHARAQGGS